jgi:hypothetical protein
MEITSEESRRRWNIAARRQRMARMMEKRIDSAFGFKRSHKKRETPSFTTDGTHLTILEAAALISRSPNGIRKAIERGHIRQMLHGRKVYVNREDVVAYPAKVILSQIQNGKTLAIRLREKKAARTQP